MKPAGSVSGGGMDASSYLVLEDEGEAFSIGEYIATLLSYKWLILIVILLAVLMGGFNAFTTTPKFKADALLQVEDEVSGLAAMGALDALQPLADTSSVSAEIEILRSRMILGQVVDKLKLQQIAVPNYAPWIGEAVARRYSGVGVAKPWFGQAEKAWGGEVIQVQRLDVPEHMLGLPLILTATENGQYRLGDQDGSWSAEGRVGETLQYALPSGEKLELFVSQLKARPGTQFSVRRDSREAAISSLASQLGVAEKGRGSGILQLSLSGHDRKRLITGLNEVMNVYVRQNVEHHSAEAENTLAFLEVQLPALKEKLDASEAAYNNYRLQKGSVDLTQETQAVLEAVVEIDNQVVALQQEREELRQRFKPQHPSVRATDAKIRRLSNNRAKLEEDVSQLPGTQQEILRLARDVEVDTHLYTELLNTAQQLRVAKAGTVGNVRIIDTAVAPPVPIAPRKGRIVIISLILGMFASLAIIWLLRHLRVKVEDPEVIERSLGISVFATVPHSKVEQKLSRDVKQGKSELGVLAAHASDDDAVESLRSLRTTLHFAMAEAEQGGMMITGPSQGIGKSFITKNLAWLLEEAGDTVVIVDADMRRGHMHREFGLPREGGLSDFLVEHIPLPELVKKTTKKSLGMVTCGTRPPNASELLMNPRFDWLIQSLLKSYNHVIIDAPPILAVSDAAIIGRSVGTTLMVAKAGQHPIQELEQAVKRLSMAGIRTAGFIMNDLDTVRMRYRYGYSGYQYQYKYSKAKD